MIEISVPFIFPGEGAMLDGAIVTADTPIDSSQLEYMPGTPAYYKRLERILRAGNPGPSPEDEGLAKGPLIALR